MAATYRTLIERPLVGMGLVVMVVVAGLVSIGPAQVGAAGRDNGDAGVGSGQSQPWGTDLCRLTPTGQRDHRMAVILAYCTMLNRHPDPHALRHWGARLAGGDQITAVIEGIGQSDEFRDREVLSAAQSLARMGTARPADNGLRKRQPITVEDFGELVESAPLRGVEMTSDGVALGRFEQKGQRIHVVLVHLSQVRVQVSPASDGRATVGSYARSVGGTAAINGNWFGPWDGPAVSDGEAYGGHDHGYTALFGFTADGSLVAQHHSAVNGQVDDRVVEAVAGHPTLIHRGRPTTDFGGDPTFLNRHPRSAIGVDATGDVLILVTADGRSSSAQGLNGPETVAVMEAVGAHDAVMLDGGGSATLWVATEGVVNQPSGGLRSVGNQLVVVPRGI